MPENKENEEQKEKDQEKIEKGYGVRSPNEDPGDKPPAEQKDADENGK